MTFALMSKSKTKQATPRRRGAKWKPLATRHAVEAQPGLEMLGVRPATAVPTIQTKLKIGEPNDKFEQEADRVADQVMRMPDSAVTNCPSFHENGNRFQGNKTTAPIVQRVCSECSAAQANKLQRNPLASSVTPPKISAVKGPLMAGDKLPSLTNSMQQRKANYAYLSSNTSPDIQHINTLQGRGQPLTAAERAFFEPRFRHNFSQVRIHSDSRAANAADSVNARAFTMGQDVVFGAGQYKPQAFEGKRLLAHELTHVVQQSGGSNGVSESPTIIQRGLGDGHDLQSPWLAGDLRLEDIFDDDESKFLRQGSRGTSVKRVQQLLFFLGFDIGPAGADGIFGPDTDAAVRAFQTQSAPPVDGIIGPITIGALDREANQPEPNRTTPGPTPAGPPVGTPPSISVDRIDVIDSPTGAIGGYPGILGNADLNVPGPFNDPTEVKHVHQIRFHLDNGNSTDLTPLRELQRTATLAGGVVRDNPPDEVLPPGVAGPTRPGGFTGVLIGNDGPPAFTVQRPTADTIVIADAPGLRGLTAASFPVTYRSHFILTVSDNRNAPIARINYDVLIDRRSVADVPNTENRIVTTATRDFVRGKNL